MEFIVSRNYTNLVITKEESQEYVSVIVSSNDFENKRYGGIVMASEHDRLNAGILTSFRTNPAYRQRFEDKWIYCTDDKTLIAFLEDDIVYIVMESDSMPAFHERRLSKTVTTQQAPSSVVFHKF